MDNESDALLPAEVLIILEEARTGLRPFRTFIEDTERDIMVIPSHLVVLQELIDAFASLVSVLPAREYDSTMRQMSFLREQLDTLEHSMPQRPTEPLWQRTMSGRLRVYIDSDTLCELVEKEFTDDVIAIMLGTSLRTVERRRAELGLRKRGGPAVSDDELYAAIRSTYALGFEAGERGMRGALRSIGLRVSRERLRVALREVDPQNLQARWAKTIRRREYYVPFVNSLWHIDGHHKSIRYKIVIHGGVDGKSRTVTFMQASPNNRAETVTACFLAATQQWGWPSRVRADHGGENLGVKGKMEEARGVRRGSFIQGPSTRNQRIERMWVDVQRWTTAKYKAIFTQLESDGLLDVTSSVHLWCLHLVFLPQLNDALAHFQDSWNRHPMRTGQKNWSPEQMHTAGVLEAERKGFDLRRRPEMLEEVDASDDMRVHALRDFADYGADDGREERVRREDDPHVAVDPVERDQGSASY